MKPVDILNDRKSVAACEFCCRVVPHSETGSGATHDLRQFTCIAPGGLTHKRAPTDEPCLSSDCGTCIVWKKLPKVGDKK